MERRSQYFMIFCLIAPPPPPRCSHVFPREVMEDHKRWPRSRDEVLVLYVDSACRSLSTSPSRLMPDEIRLSDTDLVNEQFQPLQGQCLGSYFLLPGLYRAHRNCLGVHPSVLPPPHARLKELDKANKPNTNTTSIFFNTLSLMFIILGPM